MFKYFSVGILIRIVALIVAITGFAYVWLSLNYTVNLILFSILVGAVSFELYRYVSKSMKDVQYFLDAMYYEDLSQMPHKKVKGKKLTLLYNRLLEIKDKYRFLRIEKEEQLTFLKAIIQSAPIGIIAWNKNGDIIIFNERLTNTIGLNAVLNTERIKKLRPLLWQQINQLTSGTTGLMKYEVNEIETALSAKKIEFLNGQEKYTVVVINNIGDVIDQAESGAWEKLITILTHELMNGATIISSLSDTMVNILDNENPNDEDLSKAAAAIHKRSNGLLRFVDDYRLMTQIPNPRLENTSIKPFLEELTHTWKSAYPDVDISVSGNVNIAAHIDPNLLHQALDNLILNSVHAMSENLIKRVKIDCSSYDHDRIQITFSDNGKGMDKQTLNLSTVPFFTTRDNGSGVGLSLCRQFVRSHKGRFHITSKPNEGTKVFMQLPR